MYCISNCDDHLQNNVNKIVIDCHGVILSCPHYQSKPIRSIESIRKLTLLDYFDVINYISQHREGLYLGQKDLLFYSVRVYAGEKNTKNTFLYMINYTKQSTVLGY